MVAETELTGDWGQRRERELTGKGIKDILRWWEEKTKNIPVSLYSPILLIPDVCAFFHTQQFSNSQDTNSVSCNLTQV